MKRPVIGITSNFGPAVDETPREQSCLLAGYSDGIFLGGGLPLPLPVPSEYDDEILAELVACCDGLLFTGGFDLHPHRFDEPPHPKTILLHGRREPFEMDFFRVADAAGLPLMGVCLGQQVAHLARGGRLIQHVDDLNLSPNVTHHLPRDANAFHDVRIEPDSRLAQIIGATTLEVASRHHQVVDPAHQGAGLRTVAMAPDGVIEASEDCDGRFLLTVQWHPEDILERPQQVALFAALVEEADKHRKR